jgi:uncharacterized membrane protein YedE/YeeE
VKIIAFLSGVIFAIGLAVSGMTQPSKVLGFLDLGGGWDPSLALVMVSAIGGTALAWRWLATRRRPLLGGELPEPAKKLEPRVLAAEAIFGIGWGLAGYCPGPAVASVLVSRSALTLVVSMLLGIALYEGLRKRG